MFDIIKYEYYIEINDKEVKAEDCNTILNYCKYKGVNYRNITYKEIETERISNGYLEIIKQKIDIYSIIIIIIIIIIMYIRFINNITRA